MLPMEKVIVSTNKYLQRVVVTKYYLNENNHDVKSTNDKDEIEQEINKYKMDK